MRLSVVFVWPSQPVPELGRELKGPRSFTLNSKIQKIVVIAIAFLPAVPSVVRGASFPSRAAAGQTISDPDTPPQDKSSADQPSGSQGTDKKTEALKKYLEAQRLEKANNYTGAVNAYKDAIVLDPASAELRVALGSLYLKNRNFIDAETQAREALKVAPSSIDARKLD